MSTLKRILVVFLVSSSLWTLLVHVNGSSEVRGRSVLSFRDGNGIRVVFNDVELYFNASNGGEITEYYDLSLDPLRQRNLVTIHVAYYKNLLPLFASIFYRPRPVKLERDPFSTGGDSEAIVEQIVNTSQYVIVQTSSRMICRHGKIAVDIDGNPIYVNSTWIIRNDSVVFVERTLCIKSYASIPEPWEWYPFYFTRVQGFDYNATFYMFNTTYTETHIVNKDNYPGPYDGLPKYPNDTNHVFGVAIPFANTTIEGDGTHNIVIVYKYDELVNVTEWKSDNFNQRVWPTQNSSAVTETGPKHRFSSVFNISTHTYHMMINFTHQPINDGNVQDFAKYFVANFEQAHLMKIQVTTNKSTYHYGDPFVVSVSGLSNYDLNGLFGRFAIHDNSGKTVFKKYYGPYNLTKGQTFNITLLSGTVSRGKTNNYTITFRAFSFLGIVMASDSKIIELIPPLIR